MEVKTKLPEIICCCSPPVPDRPLSSYIFWSQERIPPIGPSNKDKKGGGEKTLEFFSKRNNSKKRWTSWAQLVRVWVSACQMVVATPPPRPLGSLKTIESNRDSEEERENENNKIKYVTGLWILIIFPTAPGWSFPLFAHFGHEYSSFFPSRIGLSSCFSCCGGERTVRNLNKLKKWLMKCFYFVFIFSEIFSFFLKLHFSF